ncbi:MAG: mechanosensitive ion channel [Cytophagales bacterium]|nr:mechanosensitive ion channel [Cytophagales bacterium]
MLNIKKIITLTILIILYVNLTVFAHSAQIIEMPGWVNNKFFGLKWEQYLLILLFIFISFVIHKILSWFFSNLLVKILAKTGRKELYEKYIRPVTRPFSLFIIFCLLSIFIPLLDLPVTVNKYVSMGIKAIIPLYGILIFYRLVDILGAYLNRLAAKTESALDDQLVPLISKSLKVFVVIMGVLFILQEILNVNITALLAGLSIGGLAFALAAQDTIKNFFGSLMVFIDRPFHIGDWIVSNDVNGMVEEVGFRSTRIRTFHNSVISIPNGKLADMTIDNMGLRAYRRFSTSISITYDTPPDAIEAFVEGLRQIVEKHPNTRKDYYNIYLNDMADSSLNILFYVFFSVPDWTGELKARQEIILSIIRLAEKLDIRFAFPTETIHVENFPEKKSLTPENNPTKKDLMNKIAGFIKSGSR